MLCAKFGWNWPIGTGAKRFLNFINTGIFSLLWNNHHFEKGVALHLKKIESPLPKDAFCQVWWNWPSGSREEEENVKSLQTDGRTAGDQKFKLMSFKLLEIIEIKAAYTIKEKSTSIIFMKIRIRYLVSNKSASAEGTIS